MRALPIWIFAAMAAGCTARAGTGEEETTKNYDLAAQVEPTELQKGDTGTFTVTITPRDHWKLKTTTPLQVTLEPSAGLQLAKRKLDSKDIVDPNSAAKSVRTGVTATAAGKQKIKADLSFFLCTEQMCKRETGSLEVPVVVK